MTDSSSDSRERLIVGCMTGTSLDAVDAALVSVNGMGLGMRCSFVGGNTRDLALVRDQLRPLADGVPQSAGDFARAAWELSLAHVDAIKPLVARRSLDLIAVHGQTILHAPPLSTQLIQPAPIVRRFATPVVFDLRAADLAAGGQGAPITPLADYVLFRANGRRAVVNLGGFANYTILPAVGVDDDHSHAIANIRGGDICACNHLLDEIARRHLNAPFDEDGRTAQRGTKNDALVELLCDRLSAQRAAGRSLGSGDEAWDVLDSVAVTNVADLLRSACVAIASVVAVSVGECDEVLIAGGATKNLALVEEFSRACSGRVIQTDKCGVPSEYREAVAMAVLGALSADGVPITLPQITGCSQPAPRAGAFVYPP